MIIDDQTSFSYINNYSEKDGNTAGDVVGGRGGKGDIINQIFVECFFIKTFAQSVHFIAISQNIIKGLHWEVVVSTFITHSFVKNYS